MSETAAGNKSGFSIVNFIQNHRMAIFAVLGGLIVAALGLGIYIEVSKNFAMGEVQKIEYLSKQMQEWTSLPEGEKKTSLAQEIESLLATEEGSFGYEYARAQFYFSAGQYWSVKKDWEKAAQAFRQVGEKASGSYLAGVALLNLQQASEEMGKVEEALAALNLFLEKYKDNGVLAPQAYFAKARLLDSQGKTEEAAAAFQALVEAYPESDWTNLAKVRIIQLKK